MKPHRRFVLPDDPKRSLPLAVESIGLNPSQERIVRPNGYPVYHWLQTTAGRGMLQFEGRALLMPAGTGVLLFPGVSHTYESTAGGWETAYLTFGGPAAAGLLSALGIHESALFQWPSDAPTSTIVETIVERLETEGDVLGIEASTGAYRLLVTLMRYGTAYGKGGDSGRLDKLRTVIEWMERRYDDPDVGLEEISAVLQLSNRRLTGLFRETFGLPPYAYFIQMRIRKAKEMLVSSSPLSIREVAGRVGFRDASHFVATFRRHVGMTPEQFRRLH